MKSFFSVCIKILLLTALANYAVAESRGLSVTYKSNESSDAKVAGSLELYGKSYALVIGIDDYTNGWPRLSQAVADATRVGDALEVRGFDVVRVYNPNSDQLDDALENFFIDKGDDENARLFIWFAGHGHTMDGEGFLVPANGALPSEKKQFLRQALSLREFGRFVRLADAKHVYTVFDSCFAGTIFNVARSAPPPAITRVTANPVRQFMSSGDAGQTVADNGNFANLFIEAIEGRKRADLNTDGYVTAGELGTFMTDKISNYTNNKQIPRHGKLNDPHYDGGDFVFSLNQNGSMSTDNLHSTPAMNVTDESTTSPLTTKRFYPSRRLTARYDLSRSTEDMIGSRHDLIVSNAQIEDGALYMDGHYYNPIRLPGSNVDKNIKGTDVRTPKLSFLYNAFVVSVKFMPVTNDRYPVIAGGRSHRWFIADYGKDTKQLELTFNNGDDRFALKDSRLTENQWHTLTLSVDFKGKEIRALLDNNELESISLPDDFALRVVGSTAEASDKELMFTNWSEGNVFHGYLQSLSIYSRAMPEDSLQALHDCTTSGQCR